MEESITHEGLKRVIGIRELAACAINNTIGGGIFVLPAIVAASLGSSSIIAYLICGVLIFMIIMCFAEIGAKVTTTGGAYLYIENAFGRYAGFLANTFHWFGYAIMSDAAIANALADTLSLFFPVLRIPVYRAIFFAIILGGLVYINIRGVKQGVFVVELSTFAKLIPLLIIIVAGSFFISPVNLSWSGFPEIKSLGEVSLVLFFAFIGSESALSTGGEIRNPKKTVPIGILLGIGGTILIYLLIQTVSQGVMGNDLAKFKEAPLAELAFRTIGPAGLVIITIGMIISIFGTISGDVLAGPRILFGASKDKMLPEFLSRVHPKFKTPYLAIITYGAIIFLLSISGGFIFLATLSSAAILIVFLGVVSAVIKLRMKSDNPDQAKSFKVPFGFLIPVIAIVTILWFLSNLALKEIISISVFLFTLSVIYILVIKRKSRSPVE
jgi:APA family basic amino acid/polyamine antiporter